MSDLYAPRPTPVDNLSADERLLVELYRQLSETRRKALLEVMEALVEHTR